MYANSVLNSRTRDSQAAGNGLTGQLAHLLAQQEPGADAISPEQLLAAGYSNCFMKTLKSLDHQHAGLIPAEASITADVIVDQTTAGPSLDVELSVSLPGLDREIAAALVDEAHQNCHYGDVAMGRIEVRTVLL